MTRAHLARIKRLELIATRVVKKVHADPEKYGFSRFGENGWQTDDNGLFAVMGLFAGMFDGMEEKA